MRAPRAWSVGLVLLSGLVVTSTSRAEDRLLDLRLRGSLGGGLVLSADQHRYLGLDLPLVEGQMRVGWIPLDFLVLEVGLAGGAFFASGESPGALLDLSLGAEVHVDAGGARPWASLHVGPGWTGDLVRPVLRVTAGVDVVLSPELAVGPAIGYGHVFQEDGRELTDDAQYLTLALTLTWRPPAPGPAAPPPTPAPPRPARPARARPPPPPPPPARPTEELMALIDDAVGTRPRELLVAVLFPHDSNEIVPCSLPALHALREHLVAHPRIRLLEIEGHADGSGSDAYNDALSLRRAEAIRAWLVARGIEAERLRVSARGERAPVESNDEDGGREQNRRARFRVLLEEQ